MKTKLSNFVLAVLLFVGLPLASSSAYVAVSVGFAPPAYPIYDQPLAPGPGYIWTPGYWAYGPYGYYWVPGVWVLAPQVGFLWTPPYWGFVNGAYVFHDGYWGPHVGFYGGINYGYGYYGSGYAGGRWVGSAFHYNTAASHVNTTVIKNTYINREAVRTPSGSQPSFNGKGGVQAQATAAEKAAAKGPHVGAVSAQRTRANAAKNDPALRAKANNGKPSAEAVSALQNKQNNNAAANAATNAPANSKKGAQAGNREQAQKANRAGAQDRATQREQTAARTRTENANRQARKTANSNSAQHAAKTQHNAAARPATQTRHAPTATAHRAAPKNAPTASRAGRRPPTVTNHPQAAKGGTAGRAQKKKGHNDDQNGRP